MTMFDAIAHIINKIDALSAKIDHMLSLITQTAAQEQKDMTALDDAITSLKAAVAANTSEIASARTLIQGIGSQITNAVAAALAAGATAAQLAELSSLGTTLASDDAGLASDVVANTPAAPAPATPAAPAAGS